MDHMKLVIVESPTKAKTLSRFLGNGYEVVASRGHVRDIPSNKMNIDIDHNFEPVYQVSEEKQAVVKELVRLAKKADQVYLAMDPDREGEAIAFHVETLLKDELKKHPTFQRITFHQITKQAVDEAIDHAGSVNMPLVDAQQARRVLDRLVGYSLSPVLWRKVRRGLSAGRVQSVALRLIVEREKEIEAFVAKTYFEIKVETATESTEKFWVTLEEIDGNKIVTGKDDDRVFVVNTPEIAEGVVKDLPTAKYQVEEVIRKDKKLSPKPPFTTSLLQQSASNSYGWTAKKTMQVAQSLYERGLITYHRTDSFHLAKEAVAMVREFIGQTYGAAYLPSSPRFFKTKNQSAQEAHEAIRPTAVTPLDQVGGLDASEHKLYGMIWRRFVACQMTDALTDATTVRVVALGKRTYGLKATGSILKFDGWRTVYKGIGHASEDVVLPDLVARDPLTYQDLTSEQKQTQPPPRYNDASLVKALEELGIGRPSTYAPTISTLMNRGYMERVDRRFIPTPVGTTVTEFLTNHFKTIMDYRFTADMEEDLDEIADGKKQWVPVIKEFWQPFTSTVKEVGDTAERVKVPAEKLDQPCPECGKDHQGELVIRSGRFGKFISCSRYPECTYTAKLELKVAGQTCPTCGEGDVVIKRTRTGRSFYGCNRYPECDWASWTKPGADTDQGKANKSRKRVARKKHSRPRKSVSKKR